MKIRTRELSGAALDWAVAKCEGRTDLYVDTDGELVGEDDFDYSTDWSQGGPIIEREGIEINVRNWTPSPGCRLPGKYEWSARLCYVRQTDHKLFGPTPLVAAMRLYIAIKIGYEVEVPDELCACRSGGEWGGSPHPDDPDNAWQCDTCGRRINCDKQ